MFFLVLKTNSVLKTPTINLLFVMEKNFEILRGWVLHLLFIISENYKKIISISMIFLLCFIIL